MRRIVLLAIFAFILPRAVPAAEPSVWTGLVLATNVPHPKEAPLELRKFKTKLEKVFGYNQVELIGQHTELMDDPSEHWLIPSKSFSLRVDSRIAEKSCYLMKLELFEDAQMLTHFEAKLGRQSPLFIRGPLYASGQLIFILLVK